MQLQRIIGISPIFRQQSFRQEDSKIQKEKRYSWFYSVWLVSYYAFDIDESTTAVTSPQLKQWKAFSGRVTEY